MTRKFENIIHIVLSLECGGLEKMVFKLAREQNKRGFCSELICFGKKGDLHPIILV